MRKQEPEIFSIKANTLAIEWKIQENKQLKNNEFNLYSDTSIYYWVLKDYLIRTSKGTHDLTYKQTRELAYNRMQVCELSIGKAFAEVSNEMNVKSRRCMDWLKGFTKRHEKNSINSTLLINSTSFHKYNVKEIYENYKEKVFM